MANKITKCNTLESLISYNKRLDISHDKLHYKSTLILPDLTTIVINNVSLIDKYIDYLQSVIMDVTLTETIYQPKALCFEMYGTTELWSSILRINNLTSITQFNLKKLKLFTTDVFNLLNEILILEKNELKKNRQENGL